ESWGLIPRLWWFIVAIKEPAGCPEFLEGYRTVCRFLFLSCWGRSRLLSLCLTSYLHRLPPHQPFECLLIDAPLMADTEGRNCPFRYQFVCGFLTDFQLLGCFLSPHSPHQVPIA